MWRSLNACIYKQTPNIKYILLSFIASQCCLSLPAQKLTTGVMPGSSSLYETYIEKSRRKFKAAHTLKYVVIVSAVTSGIFFLVAAHRSRNIPDEIFSGLGDGIVGLGFGVVAVGSGLTSILLKASARTYKKRL